MMRVCVVGGGLTGAAAAAAVRLNCPQAHIEIWDKATVFGGRLCTKRSPGEPRVCIVDVGAQYVSSTPHNYAKHKKAYDDLLSNDVLRPLECNIKGDRHPTDTRHFVAPRGMARIVQHYVVAAVCTHRLNTAVQEVSLHTDGHQLTVHAEGGVQDSFDRVLLTLPVPQLLALRGELSQLIDAEDGLRKDLEKVEYSSRFCLGLFYPVSLAEQIKLPGDNVGAMYLSQQDAPFCYIAVDNTRRNMSPAEAGGVSVILHTTRQFGAANVDTDKSAMLPVLLRHFAHLMPTWPPHTHAICHKWRYSQVTTGVSPRWSGSVSLAGGRLVLSGDSFTASGVDGCLSAAHHAALALTAAL